MVLLTFSVANQTDDSRNDDEEEKSGVIIRKVGS